MKKRTYIWLLFLVMSLPLMAQTAVGVPVKMPQVRTLEAKGWTVQHSTLSFDSLTIYFSAKEPNSTHFDLYVMHAEGWRWGSPERIESQESKVKSQETDKLWPTISSDEGTIYYVQRDYVQGTKDEALSTNERIHKMVRVERMESQESKVKSQETNGERWKEDGPIIITGQHDTRPQIAEDNRTLTFWRKVESRKSKVESTWLQFRTERMDEHNWMLPVEMENGKWKMENGEAPNPLTAKPITVVTGTIVHEYGKRPLATGRVYVYDAITQQLRQVARVHSVTGRFRIALQQGESYRLDITADGFSHHYERLEANGEGLVELGTIALSEKLQIALKLYDQETQEILGEEKQDLRLGQVYDIPLRHDGYHDTTMVLDTKRQVLFSATEIDFPLRPRKQTYHIDVTDKKTGQPIDKALIRMDGRTAPRDTSLRVGKGFACSVSAEGYLFFDTIVESQESRVKSQENIVIRLQPIEKDLVVQLRAIQFAYDSHELSEESYPQLEQLLNLMQQNPTLRIELSAHTDDRGADKYNDRLSTLRGESVAQWLTSHGIAANRIEAKGYGKRKPLVANDSEEHRALNRRVEIKVIDF